MIVKVKNYSIWLENNKNSDYPTLKSDYACDVLIIGAGITGINVAYNLINTNLKVCVVEKNKIGLGISCRTTGKTTYLQGNIYSKIAKIYSDDVARKYYESQKYAIREIEKIIKNNNISCNYEKQTSFLFANDRIEKKKIIQEERLLQYFNVKYKKNDKFYYSISVSDTAYFNAFKYIQSLGKICSKNGINIFENTNITGFVRIGKYYYCCANNYVIKCKSIVLANHYPSFIKPFFMPFKTNIEKSYMLAKKENNAKNNSGINMNENISFRNYYDKYKYYIYLNGTHNISSRWNEIENFNNLIRNFSSINNIWSNTDIITHDFLPYIGHIKENLYIATGYNTWGMTNSFLAGEIIKDIIIGKKHKYQALFNPNRNISFYSYLNIFKSLFYNVKSFTFSKIHHKTNNYKNVIFKKIDGKNIAIYLDEDNKEHIVYTTCPHLKCTLIFNEIEKTWDCPCHASKFNIDGKCLIGPSNCDITYKG